MTLTLSKGAVIAVIGRAEKQPAAATWPTVKPVEGTSETELTRRLPRS